LKGSGEVVASERWSVRVVGLQVTFTGGT